MVYSGATGFNNSTSTLSVNSEGTSTDLYFGTAYYGGTVEFVANVTSPIAIINEGSVEFYINNVLKATVDVVNGVARYNYSCSEIGTFSIRAIFTGSGPYESSLSATKQLTISKLVITTLFNNYNAVYGETVELVATISSNLAVNEGTVKFYVNNRLKATVDVVNGVAHYNYTCDSVGTYSMKATYSGSTIFEESSNQTNIYIDNIITVVTVDNIDAAYGEVVTLKANVSSNSQIPTGWVSFYINEGIISGVQLSNGIATCSYTCNNGGNFIIRVSYDGTKGFSASNGSANLYVSNIATITTVNPVSASYDDVVDLTATITTNDGNIVSGGIVTFYVDGSLIGSGSVNANGVATCSYTCTNIGDLTIRADYGGNAGYGTSSNTSSLSVSKLSTVISMESASISSNNVTLVVNVHSNLAVNEGIVTFYMNGTKIGNSTVNNGVTRFTYYCEDIGIFNVKVDYSGSDIFNSSSLIYELNIDGLKTIININPIITSYGDVVDLTATVKTEDEEVVDGGNVTFYLGNTEIATVSVVGGIASYSYNCSAIGNFTITVHYSGHDKYNSSTNSSNLNVNPLNTIVSVSDTSASYGDVVDLTATVEAIDGVIINEGNVTFYLDNTEIGTANVVGGVAHYSYTCDNVGSFTIKGVFSGFNSFNPSNSTSTLKVIEVDTFVTLNPVSASYGDVVDLTATVKTIKGDTIINFAFYAPSYIMYNQANKTSH